MKAEKVRNLTDDELLHQERELNDQLFKLKFQLNMGQTESLKKMRGLRKEIARGKTIARERRLAGRAREKEKCQKLRPPGRQASARRSAARSFPAVCRKPLWCRWCVRRRIPSMDESSPRQRSFTRTTKRTKRVWATLCGSRKPARSRN